MRAFVFFWVLCLAGAAAAAEYQWSVPVPSVISEETRAAPRAYLWVPPACERLRTLVLGQHNMLEEPLFESPVFREAMAKLGAAIVWVTPPLGGQEKFEAADAAHFEAMCKALAEVSGYEELVGVPVVPDGHSAMAEFPYLFAAALPQRTLAAVSLKGSWPDLTRAQPQAWIERFAASGVPLLFVSGEYEWAEERAGKVLAFRRQYPSSPFSMIADAGGGHFDHHDEMTRFIAGYIGHALEHRLDKDSNGRLRPVDAAREGWLVDRWRKDKAPRAAAVEVAGYRGEVRDTLWCFNQQQASDTERLQGAWAGRKAQLLGYQQNGETVPQVKGTHQQVTLEWLPDPAGDGATFHLDGCFLNEVPAGRPERWTGLKAGALVGHAAAGGPVTIRRICGPVAQLDERTFTLRFDRLGFDNEKRSNEIWFQAEHPGDAQYQRAVQQAVLHFPLRNREGRPQTISFEAIPDQKAGALQALKLKAASSAEARVQFYVREGPAEVAEDTLAFTPLPRRAKLPVTVTVVAWQWGRGLEPKLQTAEPVTRQFQILP